MYETTHIRRTWTRNVGFLIPIGFFIFAAGGSFGDAAFSGVSFLVLIVARNFSTLNRDLTSGTAAVFLRSRASPSTLVLSKWLIQFLATAILLLVIAAVSGASEGRGFLLLASFPPLLIAAAAISVTMMALDLVPKSLAVPLNFVVFGSFFFGLTLSHHSELVWTGYLVPLIGGAYAMDSALNGLPVPVTLYPVLAVWVFLGIVACGKRFEYSILDRL